MKKVVLILAIVGLYFLSGTVAQAYVSITSPDQGEKIYRGEDYQIRWTGSDEGVSSYAVYLVNDVFRGTDFGAVSLGEVSARDRSFNVRIPSDMPTTYGYHFQLSGRYASGDESEAFTIAERPYISTYYNVRLSSPNRGTLIKGDRNLISWSGGRYKVQVGIEDQDGNVLGWISVDEEPDGRLRWDAKEVCDLEMRSCQSVSNFGVDKFRIVVVSADRDGNYMLNGNADRSDYSLRIEDPAVISVLDSSDRDSGLATTELQAELRRQIQVLLQLIQTLQALQAQMSR